MTHTITVEEMERIEVRQRIASSKGNGENKSLDVVFFMNDWRRYFVVTTHKGFQGFAYLEDAVRVYNEAH